MKAIETIYKGYRFRSRLEARWAVFFDALGIWWEYEPEGMVLSDGSYYLPDFFLIDMNCYFEVKRPGIQGMAEGKEAIRKISDGMESGDWAGLICFGDPMDDNVRIFCQEVDDGGAGPYSEYVTIGIHPDRLIPYLFAHRDRRGREFYTAFDEENGRRIPMATGEYGKYKYGDFVGEEVSRARLLARQVRFEHGEVIRL